MGIATSLRKFLESNHLAYDVVHHKYTESSKRSASVAHLPGNKVAKAVLLSDGEEYTLAVLPASHRLHFGHLHHHLNRQIGLATEKEIATLFTDCQIGAIPPTGLLYDIDTLVDDALLEQPEIYFEAGDHEQLIKMSQEDFKKLLGDATHSHISYHFHDT